MQHYYKVLNLSVGASMEDIKKSYRRLAMKYHPDRHNGDKVFEEKLKDINKAYTELCAFEEARREGRKPAPARKTDGSNFSDKHPFEHTHEWWKKYTQPEENNTTEKPKKETPRAKPEDTYQKPGRSKTAKVHAAILSVDDAIFKHEGIARVFEQVIHAFKTELNVTPDINEQWLKAYDYLKKGAKQAHWQDIYLASDYLIQQSQEESFTLLQECSELSLIYLKNIQHMLGIFFSHDKDIEIDLYEEQKRIVVKDKKSKLQNRHFYQFFLNNFKNSYHSFRVFSSFKLIEASIVHFNGYQHNDMTTLIDNFQEKAVLEELLLDLKNQKTVAWRQMMDEIRQGLISFSAIHCLKNLPYHYAINRIFEIEQNLIASKLEAYDFLTLRQEKITFNLDSISLKDEGALDKLLLHKKCKIEEWEEQDEPVQGANEEYVHSPAFKKKMQLKRLYWRLGFWAMKGVTFAAFMLWYSPHAFK